MDGCDSSKTVFVGKSSKFKTVQSGKTTCEAVQKYVANLIVAVASLPNNTGEIEVLSS